MCLVHTDRHHEPMADTPVQGDEEEKATKCECSVPFGFHAQHTCRGRCQDTEGGWARRVLCPIDQPRRRAVSSSMKRGTAQRHQEEINQDSNPQQSSDQRGLYYCGPLVLVLSSGGRRNACIEGESQGEC